MRSVFQAIGRVLFWTYSRGSWQYDIMCALILAFIFLTPKEFFVRPPFQASEQPEKIEQKDRKAGTVGRLEAPVQTRLTFHRLTSSAGHV